MRVIAILSMGVTLCACLAGPQAPTTPAASWAPPPSAPAAPAPAPRGEYFTEVESWFDDRAPLSPIAAPYVEAASRIAAASLASDGSWQKLSYLTDEIGARLAGSLEL